MTVCYIGMGSNLDKPLLQLFKAKEALGEEAKIRLMSCSSLYQSEALVLDQQPQDDYLNAVLKIETQFSAEHLLDVLQGIENVQGRTRETRWGARTLDLDILLYGNQRIKTQRLTIPHAEMLRRNFVLMPLMQIEPELDVSVLVGSEKNRPSKKKLQDLLEKVKSQRVVRVGEMLG
ncbi:2-amino-4-hydroxy-6-hydroxymethyldihydropteridinepyrophosphokinase [hydrothermal vent metagenome]|uniref:2-amino-4-hydroxy-6-hydroxymethyldihydropteridine diphosphokinase n=1 Tax=hydrothermal vent metagenome TaxID=652676 RepID=A0A3B0XTV2_9ZZZZ